MANKGLDRVLDALCRQLPSACERETISRVVLAAAQALPEAKSKTRDELIRREKEFVDRLFTQCEASRNNSSNEAKVGGDEDSPAVCSGDKQAICATLDEHAAATYADVDPESIHACLDRCSELLEKAFMSLRPEHCVESALTGLLAMIPEESSYGSPQEIDGHLQFDMDALRRCAHLVPKSMAALSPRVLAKDCSGWRRFLGFFFAAPARLPCGSESEEADIAVMAAQIGRLIALASPNSDVARSAARAGFVSLEHPVSMPVLARLSASLPSIVRAGFADLATHGGSTEAILERGDLVALLHALRCVGLCRVKELGNPVEMSDARCMLIASLEVAFDATLLQAQLARLASASLRGKRFATLRSRLARGAARSRSGAAFLVAEVLEAAPGCSLRHIDLQSLADSSGLPVGGDEQIDKKASLARARGDIFFEDTVGTSGKHSGDAEDDVSTQEGDDQPFACLSAASNAAETASRRSLGHLEGVEALRKGAKRLLGEASLKGGASKKKKRKAKEAVAKSDG